MSLSRFIEAQEMNYKLALSEISSGYKRSHWMWYIFPQISGLGHSDVAKRYEIKNLQEAEEYMNHPYLRENLLEITRALLRCESTDIRKIMGYPDDLKLCSCMTLFEIVAPEITEFGEVLERYYGGTRDKRTIELLCK